MLPLVLALAVVSPAQAGDAKPAPFEDQYEVHQAGADAFLATVDKISGDFATSFTTKQTPVGPGKLVSLRRINVPLPAFPQVPQVVLANGDRLPGRVIGGDGVSLTLQMSPVPRQPIIIKLPLTAISAVWLTTPTGDPAQPAWLENTKKQDVLALRNGGMVRGTLEGFSEKGDLIRFAAASEKQAKNYDALESTGVALDPGFSRLKPPKGAYARLVLVDGARISVKTLKAEAGKYELTTLSGASLSLPAAAIVSIDVFQGKAVYLSDLKPAKVEEESFNGLSWPYRLDRSVKGDPLKLKTEKGEETFDKGLGVHSRSQLTYDLGGKYRWFEATIGLDAVSGRRGAVDVKILLDDKALDLPGLTGFKAADGARRLRIEVAKCKSMKLLVDYGPGGDVQDDFNWGDARLIEE